MLGISVVLFAVLQGVMLENLAGPVCGPPPVDRPFECCKMPQLFTDEDRAECGFQKKSEQLPSRQPPDCKQQICIMKKKNLMKDDETVDKEAVIAFLDKWTAENTEFKDVVDKAKEICLKDDIRGPPGLCVPGRIISCFFFETFNNCPTWEENEKCDKLKKHIERCKAAFE